MARGAFTAAALLLLCAAAVQASRFHLDEADTGRSLLQARQPNCTKIDPACKTCRNQRIPGTRRSELVCSTCDSGYKLRRDGTNKKCDCAPGRYMNNGVCENCPAGKFCVGGGATVNTNNEAYTCPAGLETTFEGAKSQAQCFTSAGYGRTSIRGADGKVTLSAQLCPQGTYNVGKNTAGCQKCGAGLTTESTGSIAVADCKAPAGSYMDKGIGKLCQKGTYSTELNTDANCKVCPTGITTAGEGSDEASDCALAMKGYYLVDNTTAALCPRDTYQDEEAAVTACEPCPNGFRTKEEGATGVALCLAPPGWELKAAASAISECEDGYYKADWNRNQCEACGEGIVTRGTGSVSKDACKVPAGWGLTQITPTMIAKKCEKNTYGHDQDRVAVTNARCTPCPTDMFTLDHLEGRTIGADETYTAETACLVQAGWGITNTLPQKCPVGTYNAGLNREECKQCGTGWTTVEDTRTSADQCVIQPGWEMNTADGIPEPCDKGTYSTGGIESAPNATCSACDAGFTTQEDESVAASDCGYCAAGYGGASCAVCPKNTFSAGGAKEGDDCVACATGSVSKPGATQSQQCYSRVIDARNDIFPLADESKWTADAANTAADCSAACTGDCVMYKFVGVSAATGTCTLLSASATGTKAGFKIGNADDYVVYTVDTAIGTQIATSTAATEKDCLADCSSNTECEVYRFDAAASAGDQCTLAKSELEEDSISMFQVDGEKLASYVL